MNGRHPKPEGTGWPRVASWAVTVAAGMAVAWFGYDLLRSCTPVSVVSSGADAVDRTIAAGGREVRATIKEIADVLRPTVASRPMAVIRGEDDTPKLVVFTHAADIGVDLVEDTWYGDTYSNVQARNCRAQFVVPVDRMTDADIMFRPGGEGEPARIVVSAPRPRVDTEMLVIAPEFIEFTERNTGLRHVRGWFGAENRDQLVQQIRPRLLEAVSDPGLRGRAERAGREFFENRFAEWLVEGVKPGRDVVIEVRWKE